MTIDMLLTLGFSSVFTWTNMLVIFIGSIIGMFVGVLPGLGPAATISILLPLATHFPASSMLVFMSTIYVSAMFGGRITSILIGVPGEAASAMTAIEGHAMALQGRAGAALFVGAVTSFIGSIFATVVLTFMAPPIAEWGLSFGPPEYASLMIFTFAVSATLLSESPMRGLISVCLGLIITTVGIDPQSGVERFTFGSDYLIEGINVIIPIMGFLGISEVLTYLLDYDREKIRQNLEIGGKNIPEPHEWMPCFWASIRGSVVGTIAGILPGSGPTLGTFVEYSVEKRVARDPSRFGKGAIEGVAGPESADNAGAIGAMIPMLTLGIPGSGTVAVVMVGMMIGGVQPGPLLFMQHPDVVWQTIAALYVASCFLLVINIPLVPLFVKVLKIPDKILMPGVVLIASAGAYSMNANPFDVTLLLLFSVCGYLMKKWKFPLPPLVLAVVLGDILESNLRQALIIWSGSPTVFFTRPISGILLLISLLMILQGYMGSRKTSFSKE